MVVAGFNPLTPKISLVILLYWPPYSSYDVSLENLVSDQINPLIDICLYSHHLSGWYCIDIVRRNSVLITNGSYRVKSSTLLLSCALYIANWSASCQLRFSNPMFKSFFVRSFIHSFVRPYVRQFVRPSVCSFIRSFIYLFIHSFIYAFSLDLKSPYMRTVI